MKTKLKSLSSVAVGMLAIAALAACDPTATPVQQVERVIHDVMPDEPAPTTTVAPLPDWQVNAAAQCTAGAVGEQYENSICDAYKAGDIDLIAPPNPDALTHQQVELQVCADGQIGGEAWQAQLCQSWIVADLPLPQD